MCIGLTSNGVTFRPIKVGEASSPGCFEFFYPFDRVATKTEEQPGTSRMVEESGDEFSADFAFVDEGPPDVTATESPAESVEKGKDGKALSKYESLEQRLQEYRSTHKVTFSDEQGREQEGKHKAKEASKTDKKVVKGKGVKELEPECISREDEDSLIDHDDNPSQPSKPTDSYFDAELGTVMGEVETFADMNLSRPLLKSLASLMFDRPTPIQRAAIPVAMMGKDICGGAVTGSGKTGAFLIPIMERLMRKPKHASAAVRVLILLPTRELAVQCYEVAIKLIAFAPSSANIRVALVAGGLPMKQQEVELRRAPDVVIATPGRLIDHLRNSVGFTLQTVEILVLDEADRMLEDGFADELNEIIRNCPQQRQTILFSATMTDNVDELVRLSLKRPARIFVDANTALAQRLHQEFVRIRADREEDRTAILLALCRRTCTERCIIFFPTKELAHQFRLLLGLLGLRVAELHGGLGQADRLDALERFKARTVDFLTATDVAARGLDIPGVQFVLNYSMPQNYKLYLHRVGRTARAGATGCSITLVGEGADRKLLKMVIKNATVPVKHRQMPPTVIEQHRQATNELQPALKTLLEEEKEQKLLQQTERELDRAQNLLNHREQIGARPRKTWFQTPKQKMQAKLCDRQGNDEVQPRTDTSTRINGHHGKNKSSLHSGKRAPSKKDGDKSKRTRK